MNTNTTNIIGLADLRALSTETFIIQMKDSATRQASTHLALGKYLTVLDESRDAEKHKTLKGYVKKLLGLDVESASYKCKNAFGMVGEGVGTILEAHYDAARLNWLLTVSSIMGYLEKQPALVEATRENVAVILRTPNKATDAALKAIRDSLKPEGEKEEKDEEAEKEAEKPLNFADPETLRMLLRGIHAAIPNCTPEALAVIYKGGCAITDYAADTMPSADLSKVKAELENLITLPAAELAAA